MRVPSDLTIAALGSSFAAGPTLEPVLDVDAMRSGRNYPHLLADALGATLVDLTVSGATTANILGTPQTALSGRQFAPQIDGVPAQADLVTVTAGGNDLRFIGSMMFAAWSKLSPDGPLVQAMRPDFAQGITDVTEDDIDRAAAGLAEIAVAVRARAPRARVILVDYLTVVTESTPTGAGAPFTPAELAMFLRTQSALALAYRTAARRSGADLLAMSRVSVDHALGSADPWVLPFEPALARTAGSFHPNESGMQAISAELLRLITT